MFTNNNVPFSKTMMNMKENESELLKRKQKISEHPTFKEDIDFISEQIELIRQQRDIYKLLLEQYEETSGLLDSKKLENFQKSDFPRCQSHCVKINNKNEAKHLENEHIDPFSPNYGQDLCHKIDILNQQIKNIKVAFEEKSHTPSPLKRPRPNMLESNISSSSVLGLQKVQPQKNCKSKSFESISKIDPSLKLGSLKNIKSQSFQFESVDSCQNPYKHSFCKVQAQLEYFPLRIKELEKENKELESILEKLKTKDLNQRTLSVDRPFDRKSSNLTEAKRKELERLQKQLEERSRLLDLKEKELNEREIKLRKKKEKNVSQDTKLINNINIRNSCPNNNSSIKGSHYNQDDNLKELRNKDSKINDECSEKSYACKICKIF